MGGEDSAVSKLAENRLDSGEIKGKLQEDGSKLEEVHAAKKMDASSKDLAKEDPEKVWSLCHYC